MTEPQKPPDEKNSRIDTEGGAYVGQSVHTGGGSFIGRDKVTILNFTVPKYLLWLLLVALLAGLAVITWMVFGNDLTARFRTLRMDARFNIAIVEFGEIQQSGRAVASQDGTDMSQWLYDGLIRSYSALNLDNAQQPSSQKEVLIWSRTSPDVVGHRGKFAPFLETDPEARCQAARQLAEAINAQLVIFGVIDQRNSPAAFTLEFYATADVLHSLKLNNIQTGVAASGTAPTGVACLPIGEPITVASPLVGASDREAIFQAVSHGSEFFFWLTLGLVREQLGLSQAALQNFLNLDAYFDANVSRSNARRYGQDLVNFFIGQQYIFQLAGQFESGRIDLEQLDLSLLDRAETHFQKAANLRGRHLDRALIGLGNVWTYIGTLAQTVQTQTSQEVQPDPPETPNLDDYTTAHQLITQAAQSQTGVAQLLRRAAQFYDDAATEAETTDDLYVSLIAELAQAATYWAEGQNLYLAGELEAAILRLEEAVAAIDTGSEPLLGRLEAWGDRRLVANAHQTIGLAYLQLADIARIQERQQQQTQHAQAAVLAFQRCIDVETQAGVAQPDAILSDEIITDICRPYLEIATNMLEASGGGE